MKSKDMYKEFFAFKIFRMFEVCPKTVAMDDTANVNFCEHYLINETEVRKEEHIVNFLWLYFLFYKRNCVSKVNGESFTVRKAIRV